MPSEFRPFSNPFVPGTPRTSKSDLSGPVSVLGIHGRRVAEKMLKGKKRQVQPSIVVGSDQNDVTLSAREQEELERDGHEGWRLRVAREILGERNVHDAEDVALLLGFTPREIPPIPYSLEDLQLSRVIRERTGVSEMLVLLVKNQDMDTDALIQQKYDEMGLGKFRFNPSFHEGSFQRESELVYEWRLITKSCIPGSYGRPHHKEAWDEFLHEDTQEFVIEEFARVVGVPRTSFQRPEPLDMLFAVALHLVATTHHHGKGERLLDDYFHWSDEKSVSGELLYIGNAGPYGAHVNEMMPDSSGGRVGVCLAR